MIILRKHGQGALGFSDTGGISVYAVSLLEVRLSWCETKPWIATPFPTTLSAPPTSVLTRRSFSNTFLASAVLSAIQQEDMLSIALANRVPYTTIA